MVQRFLRFITLIKYAFCLLKLASFKEERRPYRSDAASHMGATVLAHMALSAAVDRTQFLDERSRMLEP